MKSNYKRLSDLIHQVDNRNSDLKVKKLMGVNLSKEFMPSIANIIGTDLSKYKIVNKGQFACKLMSVGRDVRLPIAFKRDDEPIIISSAYYAFEINDETEILSEYLMMCFSRPEFDRELWFYSGGDVRGGISWNTFCDVKIYVPPLEKQKEIVKAYRTITYRIELKKRINDNLSETISAMFSEYYSNISNDNEVYLHDLCELTSSKRVFADEYTDTGIPFYRGGEISLKQAGKPITSLLYISEEHYNELKNSYGVPQEGDILITAVGTIGNSYMTQFEKFYFKDGNIIWLKNFSQEGINYFIYDYFKSDIFKKTLEGISIGSTQTALTIVALSKLKISIPCSNDLNNYSIKSRLIHNNINHNNQEIEKLHQLQSVLLSQLSH